MISIVKETNESLLNIVSSLKTKLDESRFLLNDIQSKMDEKLEEAKKYKVQVDDAKANIKRLNEEITDLEDDLTELKERYGKKHLVAVIEAGTKEINVQIKSKQDEIAVHKNKIAELTNRARSIKDLLVNLKKDKKIKETRLKELESSVHYYDVRLNEIIDYTKEHDDLEEYFNVTTVNDSSNDSVNVFEDIEDINDTELKEQKNEESNMFEPVTEEEADEVFNQVINDNDEIEEESVDTEEAKEDIEVNDEQVKEEVSLDDASKETEESENTLKETDEVLEEKDNENIENTHDLELNDLLSSVKEPSVSKKQSPSIESLNKAIDDEFNNIFGKNINEPIKSEDSVDIFGNSYSDTKGSEVDVVNDLTALGLDYYAFKEEDRKYILDNYNKQTFEGILKVLKDNNISLDNLYYDAKVFGNITPSELSNIITKLKNAGQSTEAISYVLDKLSDVDMNLLNETINKYGDYVKNVDLTDIIIKSLKGGK